LSPGAREVPTAPCRHPPCGPPKTLRRARGEFGPAVQARSPPAATRSSLGRVQNNLSPRRPPVRSQSRLGRASCERQPVPRVARITDQLPVQLAVRRVRFTEVSRVQIDQKPPQRRRGGLPLGSLR